jgi:hypothetical protein
MSCFWAEFKQIDGATFRFDTRIYLKPVLSVDVHDRAIGALVGKNPGSAKATGAEPGIQPIALDGDRLLPTVRSVVVKAYEQANVAIPDRGYIQVLNLFYLCDPDLRRAIATLKRSVAAVKPAALPHCHTEALYFPWVWYVWGNSAEALNGYKDRFARIRSDHHFYFDNRLGCVVPEAATRHSFARHTQGFKHDLIVPFIAGLITIGQALVRQTA